MELQGKGGGAGSISESREKSQGVQGDGETRALRQTLARTPEHRGRVLRIEGRGGNHSLGRAGRHSLRVFPHGGAGARFNAAK